MSDPNPTKKAREQSQVRAFLWATGMAFQDLEDGPDPPDIRVFREGLPPLDIELVEYHPARDRAGMEKRSQELLGILNGLIERRPALNGVSVRLLVRDVNMPRRAHHQAIAEELVQCIESSMRRGWISHGHHELLFMRTVSPGTCQREARAQLELSAQEWPLITEHMLQVDVDRTSFDFFFPAGIYQAQVAWCSPDADAFRRILEGKRARIVKATRGGTYSKCESQLWLLIATNASNDLSSFVFSGVRLKESITECGFAFADSPFDEFWLTDVCGGGRSHRIYPWVDEIYEAASASE